MLWGPCCKSDHVLMATHAAQLLESYFDQQYQVCCCGNLNVLLLQAIARTITNFPQLSRFVLWVNAFI